MYSVYTYTLSIVSSDVKRKKTENHVYFIHSFILSASSKKLLKELPAKPRLKKKVPETCRTLTCGPWKNAQLEWVVIPSVLAHD